MNPWVLGAYCLAYLVVLLVLTFWAWEPRR